MDTNTRNLCKVALIEQGFDKQVAKACNRSFAHGDRSALTELEDVYGLDLVRIAKGINDARRKRRKRVASKIGNVVGFGGCLFLTLTFNDATLASTSEETRRKYVRRFLKASSAIYVANIDYGGKKGREHYHALVLASHIDLKPWHSYGAIDVEHVRTGEEDVVKVSKYVAKLSNHAMKCNDGVAPRIIYSREKSAIKALIADAF